MGAGKGKQRRTQNSAPTSAATDMRHGDQAVFVEQTPYGELLREEYLRQQQGRNRLGKVADNPEEYYGVEGKIVAIIVLDNSARLYRVEFDEHKSFVVADDEFIRPADVEGPGATQAPRIPVEKVEF